MPALLTLNNIDPASFSRVTVDVKLRDTLLIKGDVDAVIAFDYTAIFNLIEAGIKLEDITLLYFRNSASTSRQRPDRESRDDRKKSRHGEARRAGRRAGLGCCGP